MHIENLPKMQYQVFFVSIKNLLHFYLIDGVIHLQTVYYCHLINFGSLTSLIMSLLCFFGLSLIILLFGLGSRINKLSFSQLILSVCYLSIGNIRCYLSKLLQIFLLRIPELINRYKYKCEYKCVICFDIFLITIISVYLLQVNQVKVFSCLFQNFEIKTIIFS